MTQAINYGDLLNVPFSFSSNGDGFGFRDAAMADGSLERTISNSEFPSPPLHGAAVRNVTKGGMVIR